MKRRLKYLQLSSLLLKGLFISSQFILFSACVPRILFVTPTPLVISPCGPGKEVFSYTGANQTFRLPFSCSSSPQIFVKLWGAGGGGATTYNVPGYPGGAGAYAYGALQVPTNQSTIAIVGGGGLIGVPSGSLTQVSAGFGGGGNGYNSIVGGYGFISSGGGGRSAIQMSGQELLTAAGGGGGSGSLVQNRAGGAGGDHITGGISGQAGGLGTTDGCAGQGAIPSNGGAGGTSSGGYGFSGSQFQGGDGLMNNASGGGGGYFGGGGGGTSPSDPCGGEVARVISVEQPLEIV